MIWLYKFQINDASNTFIEKLDSNVIEKLLHLDEDDLDIVLGRWDLTVENTIKEVKKKAFDGDDVIDKILNANLVINANQVAPTKPGLAQLKQLFILRAEGTNPSFGGQARAA